MKNGNQTQSPSFLLRGGLVADGEHAKTYRADVRLENGIITEIGEKLSENKSRIIPCEGLIVTAGFVDAHVHIESSMVLPQAFGEAILPCGTTTVIADPHEVVNVAGKAGLDRFLHEAGRAPVDIFTVVPSSVPATPLDTNGAGEFTAADMKGFVNRPDIVGLGEVMCGADVVQGKRHILEKIQLFAGKTIDGHTAGMPEEMLPGYTAAGVKNDHECTDGKALLARYRHGMNIYIREGSAARNSHDLLHAVMTNKLDTARFAFCTDDKHLSTIFREGHISTIVQNALKEGFSWGETARMASFNPCRFYHLGNRGNISTGMVADIVACTPDGKDIRYVFKDGNLAATDGKPCKDLHPATMEETTWPSSVIFPDVTEKDFRISPEMEHVALGLIPGQLLTEKISLHGNEGKHLPLLATVERHGRNGNVSVCRLSGYGIQGGALATSVSHDAHNVVCAGDNLLDMAVACNRLKETGGGYVIVTQGKVVDELPLPAFGLMSPNDAASVAETIARMEKKAHEMGISHDIDPFTTLSFTALPVIPTLRLLDTGLYDVSAGAFISGARTR